MSIAFTVPKWLLWILGIGGGIVLLILIISGILAILMFHNLSKHL